MKTICLLIFFIGISGTAHGDSRCAHHTPLRQAFFGDLHVHTALSSDAFGFDVRLGPDDAYRYAFGETIHIPPLDREGRGTRGVKIDRLLDFAAVTDHAEFLGESAICVDPDHPKKNSSFCEIINSGGRHPQLLLRIMSPIVWRDSELCGDKDQDCITASRSTWADTVSIAEAWNDTSSSCAHVTFPAYEWSSHRLGSNFHRNIIFRNANVPEHPLSYLEVTREWELWERLRSECLDAEGDCDVLAIPHNSNLSNGRMFAVDYPDTNSREEQRERVRLRMRLERIIEVMQHKGDSECRNGISSVLGGPDEFCGFEKFEDLPLKRWGAPSECYEGSFADWVPHLGPDCISKLSYARYALTEGLKEKRRLGLNPFQFGFMASTDTHNAMPGSVEEKSFAGHLGSADASATQRAALNTEDGNTSNNPGGLIGIWAEENSRDSLFDSMRRREVFGTSGPRIRPRFFAGWEFPSTLCDDPRMISRAYATGVPMGSELSKPPEGKTPMFLLTALRDPGTEDSAGGLLQRIQIIKGWADAEGRTHQAIFDIAGGANDADIDPKTCQPRGSGHESLCAVWQDPDFDPAIEAVYYARILENPSCRYSAWECLKLSGSQRPPACDDGSVAQVQQERAWTSPIWYAPAA
ncbi:MAG: DUF3604 domain-containing protein [Candidatus Binatia bacterium]|nr:DUF3604 domain-containing protein [Candidatus Binatia bacterium]MDG1957479.1 DUF3604 domain-containing protein [Candidatus Binatia bacterium]MDG2009393.1 DUF3604 domain-containing protein [Candidatus Binatia bacterium]